MIYIAALSAVLMCGCQSTDKESMPTLPPLETTVRTASTYTGTTVDFIYMETTASYRMPNAFDMPEFPEFPDADSADNPFGPKFYALFGQTDTGVDFPDMTARTEDNYRDNINESDRPQATAVPDINTEIFISDEDMPDDEMTVTAINMMDMPGYETETADSGTERERYTVPGETIPPEDTTRDTTYSYDINDFMPDFPDFGDMDMPDLG